MGCRCVSCSFCWGSGSLWQCLDGSIHRSRCDDMGDLLMCDQCDGSGITEECDECMDARDDE